LSELSVVSVALPKGPNDCIVADLETQGWCVTPGFLPAPVITELRTNCLRSWSDGEFRAAGLGRGEALQRDPGIRGDQVLWLNESRLTPGQRVYLDAMERLRQHINGQLFLGLFELESHFAMYPPGSRYRKHLDRFRDSDSRVVSCILYLNPDWQPADGGQLRLYLQDGSVDLQPEAGVLVCFLSARYYHEVLPARRARLSITGWFRTRSSEPL
jgi:SM-20-related protein